MKIFKLAMVVAALTAAGAAQAGPQATVIFKNNAAQEAVFDARGSSSLAYATVQPQPAPVVRSGDSNSYRVSGNLLPNSTTVVVVYKAGRKAVSSIPVI